MFLRFIVKYATLGQITSDLRLLTFTLMTKLIPKLLSLDMMKFYSNKGKISIIKLSEY